MSHPVFDSTARHRPVVRRVPVTAVALALVASLAGVAGATPSSRAGGERPAPGQRSVYDDLVKRAQAYVFAYEKRLTAIVAEERYLQEVKAPEPQPKGVGPRGPGSGLQDAIAEAALLPKIGQGAQVGASAPSRQTRRMVSDVLMVQLPDRTWYGFRDVIEVDGRRVRDREGRLRDLFLRSQTKTQEIVDESARYNIGTVKRNLNLPTFALGYLHPDMDGQFTFTQTGEETLDDRQVVVFRYVEVRRPTVVKYDKGDDLVSSGRVWIDKQTAEVLATELLLEDEAHTVNASVTVTYRRSAELKELVPFEMRERYVYPSRPRDPIIECVATYDKFRRFTVQVDESIKVPKG